MNKRTKRILCATGAVAIVAVAGVNVGLNRNGEAMSDANLANIEALATPEQPNVKDCISDKRWNCVALHPTDPKKDEERKEARW